MRFWERMDWKNSLVAVHSLIAILLTRTESHEWTKKIVNRQPISEAFPNFSYEIGWDVRFYPSVKAYLVLFFINFG